MQIETAHNDDEKSLLHDERSQQHDRASVKKNVTSIVGLDSSKDGIEHHRTSSYLLLLQENANIHTREMSSSCDNALRLKRSTGGRGGEVEDKSLLRRNRKAQHRSKRHRKKQIICNLCLQISSQLHLRKVKGVKTVLVCFSVGKAIHNFVLGTPN
jgi:hypothetical protein